MKNENKVFKTNQFGKEVFTTYVTNMNPLDLIIFLISISLFKGIDKIETIIKSTYIKSDASKIIESINKLLK